MPQTPPSSCAEDSVQLCAEAVRSLKWDGPIMKLHMKTIKPFHHSFGSFGQNQPHVLSAMKPFWSAARLRVDANIFIIIFKHKNRTYRDLRWYVYFPQHVAGAGRFLTGSPHGRRACSLARPLSSWAPVASAREQWCSLKAPSADQAQEGLQGKKHCCHNSVAEGDSVT